MAETLKSPGVLARENDQSQITQGPQTFGAAIVGPAAKGPVEIPTLVTSYTDYTSKFGTTVESGSNVYSYMTSIAANNYFQNGGTSLLVTRVTNGQFTPADSIFPNLVQGSNGLEGEISGDYTSGGTGGAFSTYTSVPTTTDGSGTGAELDIVVSGANSLKKGMNELFSSITAFPLKSEGTTGWFLKVPLNGGSGTGATVSFYRSNASWSSSPASFIYQLEVKNPGTGYAVGDVLEVDATTLGITTPFTITLDAGDIVTTSAVETVTVTTAGTGYAVGDTLTVAAADMGTPTADLVLTLTEPSIINDSAFTLETISEGEVMNSLSTPSSDGALPNGSADNIRWEISTVDSAAGTFNLIIRQGNDTTTQKSILESYNGLSLDPFSPNYIAKAIGDIKGTLTTEGSDTFIKEEGSYPNISRYVRVKEVTTPTPNYLDNSGNPKPGYSDKLPVIGEGTFGRAIGNNLPTGRVANFYGNINASDSQGLISSDYGPALSLLTNKDDYQFNVLSAPGLLNSAHPDQITQMVNLCLERGDSIAIIDLVGYGSLVGSPIAAAKTFDNSYSSTYWPWLQVADPSTGNLVYVPASTMIPGVYAYTDASSEPWFAPAGITRGGLGQVVRAERKLTAGNRDELYEANVNPIATFPAQGVVVFGQKTLQKKSTALDRVNVRRLLISLKSYISQVSNNLVFEQNSIATRNNFLAQVNPYLESVQQRQGLYSFKVVMDETNNTADVIDRNELVGQIYLQPTRTAEFIILDFNVLPTGATFPA